MKLNPDSVDWALRHINKYQTHTSLFPKPYEFDAICDEWVSVKKYLTDLNLPEDWKIREARKIFAPKSFNGFRFCTQLDPLDEIIYYALVYEIGSDIEKARVEKKRDIVISNRFLPSSDGRLWDLDYNYDKFELITKKLINNKKIKFIVLTDIADFFPSIYLHELEHSLERTSNKQDHIKSLLRLIKGISQNVSYGIPVGTHASFLLGELTLNSIDRRLIDENITFCRFVDDYRIFSKTKAEAFKSLNFITEIIFYDLGGLTLQQGKTRIKKIEDYLRSKKATPDPITPLSEKFLKFIKKEIGIEDPYQIIDVEKLSNSVKKKLDEFEFDTILMEQLTLERSNLNLIKFLLRKLSQTNNKSSINNILDNFDIFYPVVNTVISYFSSLQNIDSNLREKIGKKLMQILKESFVGQSSYNRLWILSLFANSSEWGGENELLDLYRKNDDDFTRRELIFALGEVEKDYWFSTERKKFPSQFTSWERRAFLKAYSCVHEDESYHWYKSLKKNTDLDILDKNIINWMLKKIILRLKHIKNLK